MMPLSLRHGSAGEAAIPLIFDVSLKVELEAITEEGQGILEVYSRHRDQVNEVQIENSIVRLDVNTPEEYRTAFETYGGG